MSLWLCSLPLSSQIRGAAELSQAIARLPVTGSVLHTGAHPDDEHSTLLAYLARGRHVRAAYLSVTRGEGGQNLLGAEQYEAMGLLRTQELLGARRLDGAEQFFTRAFEFGFSKSAEETFAKWGHDAVLSDVVRIIRTYRPDVIVARFSGTPQDGHGHHQAAGILTREAFRAAADPNRFPEQLREGLRAWQAKKFYLAVARFGPSENLPLPEGSVQLDLGDYDPILGASYSQIGGEGRVLHRSQGFAGFPSRIGPARSGFLLQDSVLPKNGPEKDLLDGITITLDRYAELGSPAGDVNALKALVGEIMRKYRADRPEEIAPLLAQGVSLVRRMEANAKDDLLFLLDLKEKEFSRALELAYGQAVEALAERSDLVPGKSYKVTVTVWNRAHTASFEALDLTLSAPAGWKIETGEWKAGEVGYNRNVTRIFTVTVPENTAASQPYWLQAPRKGDLFTVSDPQLIGKPESPPLMEARLRWVSAGAEVTTVAPVIFRHTDQIYGQRDYRVNVVPAVAAWTEPPALLFPVGQAFLPVRAGQVSGKSGQAAKTSAGRWPEAGQRPALVWPMPVLPEREWKVRLRNNTPGPARGTFTLSVPAGWSVSPQEQSFELARAGEESAYVFKIKAGPNARAGKASVSAPYHIGYQFINYPHIQPQYWFRPAETRLEPVNLRMAPNRKVGYIAGPGDEVPAALRQLGAAVTMLEPDDLLTGDLSPYHAIVAGIRAYTVRQDLVAANHRLLDYVRGGGVYIVQYQSQPFFGDPKFAYGPYPMEWGRPAARVTVEEAPVELLAPDHPLLSRPNRITAADFEGWVQERGLYFMTRWAPEYTPLLSCSDPGEPPQRGGMLVAPLGKGLYVYTAYAWFRQLPAGVPGAYRLWANLLSWEP